MRFFGLFWLAEGFQARCLLPWTAANLQFSRHDPLLSPINVCHTTFVHFRQMILHCWLDQWQLIGALQQTQADKRSQCGAAKTSLHTSAVGTITGFVLLLLSFLM